jgi:uncharacterized lipoprotein YbaY
MTSADVVEFEPEFFTWFKCDEMSASMIKSVRVKAGLGDYPFYTNLSESLNRHLKRKVDRKASNLIVFVDHMQDLATQQVNQVEKSIIRKGSWRLNEKFRNLEVPDDIWFTGFSTADKEKRIQRILTADIGTVIPSTCVDTEPQVFDFDDGSENEQEVLQLSLPYTTLSMDNIEIHEETLKAMWMKAASLVNSPTMITRAPGNTSTLARMVASTSSQLPHFVSVPKNFSGQFLCDTNCPMFGAYKICAHTLTTAEDNGKLKEFLTWFSKSLRKANLTKLSNVGMPTKSGKKKNARGTSKKKKNAKAIATTQRIRLTDPTVQMASTSQPITSQSVTLSVAPNLSQSAAPNLSQSVALNLQSLAPNLSQSVASNLSQSLSPQLSLPQSAGPNVLLPSTSMVNHPFQIVNCQTKHSSPYPFTLKFINNRIQKCQGCQLPFRQPGLNLQPPHDLLVSRLERRPFKSPTGEMKTPWKPSHAHYHLDMGCIQAADSTFLPSSLVFPVVNAKIS